jgi:hypothetical protein
VPAPAAPPAPVAPPVTQPVTVPIPPQPVIGSYQMTANCAGTNLYVSAAAHATGHPSIVDTRVDFFYPGSINGRGFDMGSGDDSHVVDSTWGMPAGSYTVELLLVVLDANGQEATRSETFPVTCSGG